MKTDLQNIHLWSFNFILRFFDLTRSYILKNTMRSKWLHGVFTTRSQRLLGFFFVSVAFNLILSLRVPLWALLLGPLFLGIPHLISTIRYIPKLTTLSLSFTSKKIYSALGTLLVAVALIRLFALDNTNVVFTQLPNSVELIFSFIVFLALSYFTKKNSVRILSSFLILVCLLMGSMKYPLQTLGFFVLAHNFVGFFFWILRAPSRKDRFTALLSLAVFSTISFLILFGFFDFLMQGRSTDILSGLFSEMAIGSQIIQESNFQVWARAVSAYAFGQGVHYFVWLKAIPEQELTFEHSIGFVSSVHLLKADIGPKIIYITGFIVVGIFIFAFLKNFPEARIVYLSLAAFHGYFELAALAFTQAKTV